MARSKTPKNTTPKVHKSLEGFDIKINSLGEIKMNYDLDKVNKFLDKEVDDKKLRGRNESSENQEKS